jgi:cytochrome P450
MLPFLILAAASVSILIIRHYYLIYRHKRAAVEAGCKSPLVRHSQVPFGFDFLYKLLQADKNNTLPRHIEEVWRELDCPGTWTQGFLGSWNIITNEPANIKAVLATQFADFDLGPQRKGCFAPLFANGIFSDDGPRWEHSRALLRPQFARDQITNIDALEVHVQNLMGLLLVGDSRWTAQTDLSQMFFRLTLDSSTEFLFGQSANSQLGESSLHTKGLEWSNFGPAWDRATNQVAVRFRLNDLFWAWNPKSMRDACKEVHQFADHFIDRALSIHNEKSSDPESASKQQYVFLNELAKATQDKIELRDQCLNVLLAGRDTTAGLLGWIFYLLARHPTIYAKLRQAVLNDFGPYTNPQNMDFTGLKACSYLQHVLSETLRLYPSVPFNSRRATKDTVIPLGGGPDQLSPVFIPKGTEVNYNVHVMHRRPDIWGPDALDFKPERWLNRKAGWEFLPFNGGPRICLGQQFALTTAGYTVARLVQRFDRITDLVPHEEDSDMERYFYTVTGAPIHVRVRLHEASD